MRKLDTLGFTAVAMLLGGLVTFISEDHYLPLWVAWIVGPLLWYLGFAVAMVWGYRCFFGAPQEQEAERRVAQPETTTGLVVNRDTARANFGKGPVGVLHEIPSMGGFIY
ncbi:MAG: hypothetical protein ACRD3E_01605 [Terriglobales bacterium]